MMAYLKCLILDYSTTKIFFSQFFFYFIEVTKNTLPVHRKHTSGGNLEIVTGATTRNERTGIFLFFASLNSFLLNTIFLLPGRLLSSTLSGCTLAL